MNTEIKLDINLSLEDGCFWLRSEAMKCSFPLGRTKHIILEEVKNICSEWFDLNEFKSPELTKAQELWSSLEHI